VRFDDLICLSRLDLTNLLGLTTENPSQVWASYQRCGCLNAVAVLAFGTVLPEGMDVSVLLT
jgi:hypothetical protein